MFRARAERIDETIWWEWFPLEAEVDACREAWERTQRERTDTRMYTKRPWTGYLAEVAFGHFMRDHGIGHVFNGHAAVTNDFEVAGLTTGCKSRSVDVFTPTELALIPERHWRTGPDQQYFFCCWERIGGRVVLLGAQTYEHIAEHATFHALGDGPAVHAPCLSLPLTQLLSPLVWAGRMRRAARSATPRS